MAGIYVKANKDKIAKLKDELYDLSHAIEDYLIYMNGTIFSYDVKSSLESELEGTRELNYYYKDVMANILNSAVSSGSYYQKSKIAKDVNKKVTKSSALLGRIVDEINYFEKNYFASVSLLKNDSKGNVLLHGNITKTSDGTDKLTFPWVTEEGETVYLSLDEMVNASWAYMGVSMSSLIQGKIFADESKTYDFTPEFQHGIMEEVNSVLDSAAVAGVKQGLNGSYYDIMLEDGIKSVVSKIDNSKGVPGLYQTISNEAEASNAIGAYNTLNTDLKALGATSAMVGSLYMGAYGLTGYINKLLAGDKSVTDSPLEVPSSSIVDSTPNKDFEADVKGATIPSDADDVSAATTANPVIPSADDEKEDKKEDKKDGKETAYIDEDGDLVVDVDNDENVKPIEEENEDEEGHEPGDDDPNNLKELEDEEDSEVIEEDEEIVEDEDEEIVEDEDEEIVEDEDDEIVEEDEDEDEEGHEPGDDDPEALKELDEEDSEVIEITEYTPENVPEVKEIEIKEDVTKDYDQMAVEEYKASVEANVEIDAAKQSEWISEFDELYRNNPDQLRQNLKEMGYSDSDITKMLAQNDDAYFFGRDCYVNGKRNAEIANMANNLAKADGVTDYNSRFDDANSGLINQLDIDYSKDATISDLNSKLGEVGNSYKTSYSDYSSLVNSYNDSNEKIENFRKMYGDATGWNQSQANEWNKMVEENDELYKKLMIASNTVTENEKQYLDLKQQLITAKSSYVDNLIKNRQVEIQSISTANANVEPLRQVSGTGDGVTLADMNNLL